MGDTTSTPSLVNGSSRTFKDISNDTFSGKYSLIPAAKSTNKVTFSNQTFPNKFIGDLGFDFEVWPHKEETPVACEPLRSLDVNDSESFKKNMSGVLLQAFQKLAIAGVVGSATAFGMSDVALAAGSYKDALKEWQTNIYRVRNMYNGLVPTDMTGVEILSEISRLEKIRPRPEDFMVEAKHEASTSSEMKKSEDARFLESKDDGKLNIPEEKASSPRELLRAQGGERVAPEDSASVMPNAPDSPRQPDPIVEGVGAGQQQGNNQNPGDLSEILGNHEAAEDAAARADARVRAGINLWQYMMGYSAAEPCWAGYFFGDHPEINS